MTPDQIAAIVAMATILKTVGSLPFGMVMIFLSIGPWVGMLIASNSIAKRSAEAANAGKMAIAEQNTRLDKTSQEFRDHVNTIVHAQEKRFEAVVRMYENNVEVVKNYHALANDLTRHHHLVHAHPGDVGEQDRQQPVLPHREKGVRQIMTMSTERAAMRGMLAEKKDLAARLRLRIEGNCRILRQGLNTALVGVDDMEVPMLAGQMDELVLAWGELQALLGDIARLERELA